VSVSFESRETVRYQVQEMARVERLTTDEAIAEELAAYNPLIPEPGQLRATLFVELTSDEAVREWLPRLVGIESAISLRLSDGSEAHARPESGHAARLTRPDVTSAVHYLEFDLRPEQVTSFGTGPVELVCGLAAYRERAELAESTISELRGDLLGE
jgi:hypothetical protein